MLDSNASLLDLVLWAGAIALGAGLGWRLAGWASIALEYAASRLRGRSKD